MSNYCEYCLKAKGEEKNVKELVQILQYKHPDLEPYRIFDAYEDECGTDDENKYFVCLSGYVAWSIISSILTPRRKNQKHTIRQEIGKYHKRNKQTASRNRNFQQ